MWNAGKMRGTDEWHCCELLNSRDYLAMRARYLHCISHQHWIISVKPSLPLIDSDSPIWPELFERCSGVGSLQTYRLIEIIHMVNSKLKHEHENCGE